MPESFKQHVANVADRMVDTPIVDFLYLDEGMRAYVITFVPNDAVSSSPTEVAYFGIESLEGRLVTAWMDEFARIVGCGKTVMRIAHAGGADFVFHFVDGSVQQLADSGLNPTASQLVYDRLESVARMAEKAIQISCVDAEESQPVHSDLPTSAQLINMR